MHVTDVDGKSIEKGSTLKPFTMGKFEQDIATGILPHLPVSVGYYVFDNPIC